MRNTGSSFLTDVQVKLLSFEQKEMKGPPNSECLPGRTCVS